ncbi:GGDEF domain-containing protein,EAL domain-containing protein [Idiomarina sp. A28L]|uniref:EAL domain-containing protein n=1 Tax=Idiomarina sp. A28L TaxID=1036674 RepID=UPI000213872C|nr:EAL domain-containing protein [Idiomarina sp. A28L]EGN74215.1 GGDEF domain-containing protein,EAL domain-containing protein [Idiomarina sp. A28L]
MLILKNREVSAAYYATAALTAVLTGIIAITYRFFGQVDLLRPEFMMVSGIAMIVIGATMLLGISSSAHTRVLGALISIGYASFLYLGLFFPTLFPVATNGYGIAPCALATFILLLGGCSLLKLQSKVSDIAWLIFGSASLLFSLIVIVTGWVFHFTPETTLDNPIGISLLAVIIGMLGLASLVRGSCHTVLFREIKNSVMPAVLVSLAGLLLWLSLSIINTEELEKRSLSLINQATHELQQKLYTYNNSIEKVATRWVLTDTNPSLKQLDLDLFIRDHSHALSITIFDADGETTHVSKSDLSDELDASIFADQEITSLVSHWFEENRGVQAFSVSRVSLDKRYPILFFSEPVFENESLHAQILVAIDLNSFATFRQVEHLKYFQLYLELADNMLIAINTPNFDVLTQNQLDSNYPFQFANSRNLMDAYTPNFTVVISDYSLLWTQARTNQLVLIFSFVLSLLFIFIIDTNNKLKVERLKLDRLAKFDGVTGLLRRDVLEENIRLMLSEYNAHSIRVLFIDLDGFKPINDSLGLTVGNRILAETAKRIESCLPNEALAARFSGDEFIVFLPNASEAKAVQIAIQLNQEIERNFDINALDIHLTASIGIASVGDAEETATKLIQNADVAMSEAKVNGGNTYSIFSHDMAMRYEKQYRLRAKIQRAIEDKEFRVHFQPVVSTYNHEIIGFEALARWPQPDGSFIPPGDFIPVAEQTGQIIALSALVLEEAVASLAKLQKITPELTMAINLSAQLFDRGNLVDSIIGTLNSYKVSPDTLNVELTESVLSKDHAHLSVKLNELRALGIQVSLDDFGTGFSSLSLLHRLPVDIIKIDRSFIKDISESSESRKIAESVIYLAKSLDKKIVVEGVETKEQAEFSSALHCDAIQGFYFYKPMPLIDVIALLRS